MPILVATLGSVVAALVVADGGTTEIASAVKVLRDAGLVGVMVIIVMGAFRKWWVPGWLYRQEREEKEWYMQLALRGTRLADRTTTVAEKIVGDPPEREFPR